jgi:hypothetical protein
VGGLGVSGWGFAALRFRANCTRQVRCSRDAQLLPGPLEKARGLGFGELPFVSCVGDEDLVARGAYYSVCTEIVDLECLIDLEDRGTCASLD